MWLLMYCQLQASLFQEACIRDLRLPIDVGYVKLAVHFQKTPRRSSRLVLLSDHSEDESSYRCISSAVCLQHEDSTTRPDSPVRHHASDEAVVRAGSV